MQQYHRPEDSEKVAAIAASLERDGWVGAPLVTWGDHLLTGSHRYEAASRVLDWPDYQIPTIDITIIADDLGLDWDAIVEDEDLCGIYDERLRYVLDDHIPAAILEQYGIEL